MKTHEPRIERCCRCDDPTGRAGRSEDSMYAECIVPFSGYQVGSEVGPLCGECWDELMAMSVIKGE